MRKVFAPRTRENSNCSQPRLQKRSSVSARMDRDLVHASRESIRSDALKALPQILSVAHENRPVERHQRMCIGNGIAVGLVGLGRVELPTSPLSGVRSSHLSYRPLLPMVTSQALPELVLCNEVLSV